MTHKDFVLIAGAIAQAAARAAGSAAELAGVAKATDELARTLACTNPRFDHSRFVAACQGAPLTGRDRPR